MYSGLLIRRGSGKIIGTHQKIDRIARRRLQVVLTKKGLFPVSRDILRFEGLNGPDGAKRKTPGKDEERHFINPSDKNDKALLGIIKKHEINLISALKSGNNKRAAKSAAWISHAIVDGLTPAHHFALDEYYESIGIDMEKERKMFIKVFLSGKSMRERIVKFWRVFGKKGVMMNHMVFEYSVAYATRNLRYKKVKLTPDLIEKMQKSSGICDFYMDFVKEIDKMKLYDDFCKNGWSREFFSQIRQKMLPIMIEAVLMEWYYCVWKAGKNE